MMLVQVARGVERLEAQRLQLLNPTFLLGVGKPAG
jgi:hypothetical protein